MPTPVVCPSVTPTTIDPHEYRQQIELVAAFAPRLQLDFMDGDFAPSRSMSLAQAWWPEGVSVDIHLMYRRPGEHLETLIALEPDLAILHAEAEGDIAAYLGHLKRFDMRVGVALLQDTTVTSAAELIMVADHVLIFSGNLGYFGGVADLTQLDKVAEILALRPDIEIGWDGGINASNIVQLAKAGVSVLNVGGAVQKAEHPESAYATLVEKVSGITIA